MTLSGAKAQFALFSSATPTGTNVTGPNIVGKVSTSQPFTDADVIYSATVTSNAASDVATLTFTTGAIAQTTGSPVITDGDGLDFEGVTISLASVYGVFIEAPATNLGTVTYAHSNANLPDGVMEDAILTRLLFSRGASINSPGTLALTFSEGSDDVTVTVLGKSS